MTALEVLPRCHVQAMNTLNAETKKKENNLQGRPEQLRTPVEPSNSDVKCRSG